MTAVEDNNSPVWTGWQKSRMHVMGACSVARKDEEVNHECKRPSQRCIQKNRLPLSVDELTPISNLSGFQRPSASNGIPQKKSSEMTQNVVAKVCRGLSFTEEVVEERCPHTLSYMKKWGSWSGKFEASSNVRFPKVHTRTLKKSTYFRPKHVIHMPCHLKQKDSVKKNIALASYEPVCSSRDEYYNCLNSADSPRDSSHYSKHNLQAAEVLSGSKHYNYTWEEYMLSLVSQTAADSIIAGYTPNPRKEQLQQFLNSRKALTLVHKTTDTKSEQSKEVAVNFRDPSECSEKNVEKLLENEENNVTTVTKAWPLVSQAARVSSWMAVKQPVFPCLPITWTHREPFHQDTMKQEAKSGSNNTKSAKQGKIVKGFQKWTDYPRHVQKQEMLIIHELGQDKSAKTPDSKSNFRALEGKSSHKLLAAVVAEYQSKWLLQKTWEEKTLGDLCDAMADINDHVRLAAVSACAKVIVKNRTRIAGGEATNDALRAMEELAVEKITKLLGDVCHQVVIAASIALFAIDRASTQAFDVLLRSIMDGGSSERWAAAQCLAASERCDDTVINELISHVNGADMLKHAKAIHLLRHLSKFSASVHYMLGEQLNSASWRSRLIACEILPTLSGSISKDIANKLSYLMWNDWRKDVRAAAARCLGKTGNGKLVHDALRERLTNGSESVRIDALRKLSALGIMTSSLLPSYLSCLNSEHLSVKLQAIKSVCSMEIVDESISKALLRLATEDRCWAVKARCIQALAQLNCRADSVREMLTWAFSFDTQAPVRAEACAAIGKLGFLDDQMVKLMQEKVLVEEDSLVLSEMAKLLRGQGKDEAGSNEMIEHIKNAMKALCEKGSVVSKILEDEIDSKQRRKAREIIKNSLESSSEMSIAQSPGTLDHKRGSEAAKHDFDPALEFFRLGEAEKHSCSSIPEIRQAVIPYWSESFDTVRDDRGGADSGSD